MPVPKYAAALEMLSRGIELYLRGDSYYSSLHLAGAAEEVLAVYVRELPPDKAHGAGSVSDQLKQAFLALSEPGASRDEDDLGKWFHNRNVCCQEHCQTQAGAQGPLRRLRPQAGGGGVT